MDGGDACPTLTRPQRQRNPQDGGLVPAVTHSSAVAPLPPSGGAVRGGGEGPTTTGKDRSTVHAAPVGRGTPRKVRRPHGLASPSTRPLADVGPSMTSVAAVAMAYEAAAASASSTPAAVTDGAGHTGGGSQGYHASPLGAPGRQAAGMRPAVLAGGHQGDDAHSSRPGSGQADASGYGHGGGTAAASRPGGTASSSSPQPSAPLCSTRPPLEM